MHNLFCGINIEQKYYSPYNIFVAILKANRYFMREENGNYKRT